MSAQPRMDSDAALERRIDNCRLRFLGAKTIGKRRLLFAELQRLIAQRSPQQIERMERERGLRD
jgi:hypothetical protein